MLRVCMCIFIYVFEGVELNRSQHVGSSFVAITKCVLFIFYLRLVLLAGGLVSTFDIRAWLSLVLFGVHRWLRDGASDHVSA